MSFNSLLWSLSTVAFIVATLIQNMWLQCILVYFKQLWGSKVVSLPFLWSKCHTEIVECWCRMASLETGRLSLQVILQIYIQCQCSLTKQNAVCCICSMADSVGLEVLMVDGCGGGLSLCLLTLCLFRLSVLSAPPTPSTRPAAELRWLMKWCLYLWWWRSALPGACCHSVGLPQN